MIFLGYIAIDNIHLDLFNFPLKHVINAEISQYFLPHT